MNQVAKFWDKVAPKYSTQPVPDEEVYQKKLSITKEHLTPEKTVLEFGCGTGTTAIHLAPFSKSILASDLSEKMLEIAKKKAQDGGVNNIDFRCSTLEDLKLESDSFDVVLGHSILHLLKYKENTIQEVYRILKPGGIFISSTACISDIFSPLKWIAKLGFFLGVLPIITVFSQKELVQAIQNAGFQIDLEWKPDSKKSKAVFIVAKKQ